MNLAKYFWALNPKALRETKLIFKDPQHPKFMERAFTLLSRCDQPKEVFSVIGQEQFVKAWPFLRRYWIKTGQADEFRSWWETIYEELLNERRVKAPKGEPGEAFLKIGKIIGQKRIENGMSQSDFARQAGMKQPDVSAIEAGKKNLTLATLIRLCLILNIKELPFS